MAEALLMHRLAGTGIEVSSAGVAALAHHPADAFAQSVMSERGFDISAHRAQQATKVQLAAMDLILTFDKLQGEWIRARYPELQGRVYKLGRWRENADIADPYRQPRPFFEQTFVEINDCVEDWVKRIRPAS